MFREKRTARGGEHDGQQTVLEETKEEGCSQGKWWGGGDGREKGSQGSGGRRKKSRGAGTRNRAQQCVTKKLRPLPLRCAPCPPPSPSVQPSSSSSLSIPTPPPHQTMSTDDFLKRERELLGQSVISTLSLSRSLQPALGRGLTTAWMAFHLQATTPTSLRRPPTRPRQAQAPLTCPQPTSRILTVRTFLWGKSKGGG